VARGRAPHDNDKTMPTDFDDYAERYTELHARSIEASGESPQYFAQYKVQCLLRQHAPVDAPLLDFGSGIGNLTEALTSRFRVVHAYDPSRSSVAVARARLPGVTHHDRLDTVPAGYFQTVVVSGVLHHVPRDRCTEVVEQVHDRLAPGGRVFVFEHNPLNPLTRRAVERCPYDRDASLLFPWEVKRRLEEAGFVDVALRYIVFFPRRLAMLRRWEHRLGWCAAGAQTLTVGRRAR